MFGATPHERRKAILIDGASAHCTKSALGIELFNYGGLYDVLVNCIGRCRKTAFAPLLTMSPKLACQQHGAAKAVSGAGFEIVSASSETSEDDEFIKAKIGALDRSSVCELVLFTSDKDFLPLLLQKAQDGMTVYLVSTKQPRPEDGRRHISDDMLEHCGTNGPLHFVEIAQFVPRICCKRLVAKTQCHPTRDDYTRITLHLHSRDRVSHHQLVSALRQIESEFCQRGHRLTFTIDA